MKPTSVTAPASYTGDADAVDGNVQNPPNDARLRARVAAPATTMTWAEYYAEKLSGAMGYAWAVSQNGTVLESGEWGQARSANTTSPEAWSTDVICNLASVSKTLTAVAIMSQAQQDWSFVDEHVWDYLSKRYTSMTPGTGVEKVTISDLLTMTSGLVPKQNLNPASVDDFLQKQLKKPIVNPQGHVYDYSNMSFIILQVLYEILMGSGENTFASLVQTNILEPMGITGFTVVPPSDAALGYSNANDTGAGIAFPQYSGVGAGGWLASATDVMNYMNGIELNTVLDAETTQFMFSAHLGWYPFEGGNGVYYHHNGELYVGSEGIATGVMHFTDGYDGVLLVNSLGYDVIPIMAGGFDVTR